MWGGGLRRNSCVCAVAEKVTTGSTDGWSGWVTDRQAAFFWPRLREREKDGEGDQKLASDLALLFTDSYRLRYSHDATPGMA